MIYPTIHINFIRTRISNCVNRVPQCGGLATFLHLLFIRW